MQKKTKKCKLVKNGLFWSNVKRQCKLVRSGCCKLGQCAPQSEWITGVSWKIAINRKLEVHKFVLTSTQNAVRQKNWKNKDVKSHQKKYPLRLFAHFPLFSIVCFWEEMQERRLVETSFIHFSPQFSPHLISLSKVYLQILPQTYKIIQYSLFLNIVWF